MNLDGVSLAVDFVSLWFRLVGVCLEAQALECNSVLVCKTGRHHSISTEVHI